MKNFAICIPVLNGGNIWDVSLRKLVKIYGRDVVYVIDSGSSDGSFELAKELNVNLRSISAKHFNHGGTRNLFIDWAKDCDFLIFMTQDAIIESDQSILDMLGMFVSSDVAAVCGRQIPHDNADVFAVHSRSVNYPKKTVVRNLMDAKREGVRGIFMSNSFAAYRRSDLLSINGFPESTILCEDMYVTGVLVLRGKHVAYCAEAVVRHSHNYSVIEEFRRYFDIGVFHSREHWIASEFGGKSAEGFKFAVSEFKYALKSGLLNALRSLIRSAAKLIAVKLGSISNVMPCSINRKLSMHKNYWNCH